MELDVKRVILRMLTTLIAFLLCVIVLVACSGGGAGTESPDTASSNPQQSALQQVEQDANAADGAIKPLIGVNVVDLLTSDAKDLYEQLSSIPNISYDDVDVSEEAKLQPINFVSNSEVVKALQIKFETMAEWDELAWKYLLEDEGYQQLVSGLIENQLESFYLNDVESGESYRLSRDNFSAETIQDLTSCYYSASLPADSDISCEDIANYLYALAPYDQCYVVQNDTYDFAGGAKGKGCVSELTVYQDSPFYGSSSDAYLIEISTYSISRDKYGEDESNGFDAEYSSINTANYIDSYIQ